MKRNEAINKSALYDGNESYLFINQLLAWWESWCWSPACQNLGFDIFQCAWCLFHCTLKFKIGTYESSMKFSVCVCVCLCVCVLDCFWLCDSMDRILQASLFMAFSREVCWSGLPFPSPGDLPDPGIESINCIAGRLLTTVPPGKPSWSPVIQL